MNRSQKPRARRVVLSLFLLPVVFFLVLVLGNRWLWPDMNNFINDAVGIQLNWILLILVLVFMGTGYLLILLFQALYPRRRTILRPTGILGWIVPATTTLISVALSIVLMAEAGSLLFSRPVEDYTLPPVLEMSDGASVESIGPWEEIRREEIIDLFNTYVYGPVPDRPEIMEFEIRDIRADALGGKAVRKIVRVHFGPGENRPYMDLLIYLPKGTGEPSPLFFGMNFYGNHTTSDEPDIPLPEGWIRNSRKYGITENRATVESRATRAYRWPALLLLERGYGLATVYYGDLDPDFDDGFRNGVHPLFDEETGAISAWAWGLSRAMDYFETDRDIDQDRIALMGHSRLGKAALWAGANDSRFGMVIANNPGCMGAAISRRKYGEDVGYITSTFPHWFVPELREFADREEQLPLDQHMLLSLIAPRPLYVASAENDRWSDPEGEFLGLLGTRGVYELYGLDGPAADFLPEAGEPMEGIAGYHIREGVHEVTSYDWGQFLRFADRYLLKQK